MQTDPLDAYATLKQELLGPWRWRGDAIVVFDRELYGYVVPHIKCGHTIVIAPGFSTLEKLFVLAHEVGHLFTYPMSSDGFGRMARRPQGESHANEYAIRVCTMLLERDVREEYQEFYTKIKRRIDAQKVANGIINEHNHYQ